MWHTVQNQVPLVLLQYLIDVLRGKALKRITEAGHDQLSTYGIGKSENDTYWHSILNQLIHKGLIRIDITEGATLKLTEAAKPVLRGSVTLELAIPRLAVSSKKAKNQN